MSNNNEINNKYKKILKEKVENNAYKYIITSLYNIYKTKEKKEMSKETKNKTKQKM